MRAAEENPAAGYGGEVHARPPHTRVVDLLAKEYEEEKHVLHRDVIGVQQQLKAEGFI